jgi:hypothetical protein
MHDLPYISEIGGKVDNECPAEKRGTAESCHSDCLDLTFVVVGARGGLRQKR